MSVEKLTIDELLDAYDNIKICEECKKGGEG